MGAPSGQVKSGSLGYEPTNPLAKCTAVVPPASRIPSGLLLDKMSRVNPGRFTMGSPASRETRLVYRLVMETCPALPVTSANCDREWAMEICDGRQCCSLQL